MPKAKTHRVNGKIYYVEDFVTNKRDAEKVKNKLLKRNFVGSVRRFKTAKGYEIGWSYR